MKSLQQDWVTNGWIDFEYKKFILLAYLQEVSKEFDEQKLYPVLSELVQHYENLVTIKEKKTFVASQFPQKITRLDLERFTIEFEKMVLDEACLEEVEAIIDFAIPKVKEALNTGKDVYQEVEEGLRIFPVGIVSLNIENGFLMLAQTQSKETLVYNYEITLFENIQEKFRGIKTSFIGSYMRSISNTYEAIKYELIRDVKAQYHPATFAIESEKDYPLNETFLPVAKRLLVRHIYHSA